MQSLIQLKNIRLVVDVPMRFASLQSRLDCNDGNFWRSFALAALILTLLGFGGFASRVQAQSLEIFLAENEPPIIKKVPDLVDLGLTEFTTSTVWTKGVDVYSGVLLADLLTALGIDLRARNGSVTLEAMDGYSATIAFETILGTHPLLAFHRNHRPMSVRSQGPFWLVFDYDSDVRLRTETLYALSVWQVTRLIVNF